MGKVSGNAGGVDDIVQGELVDVGRGLEKKGQWLLGRQCWASTAMTGDGATCPMPPEAPATTALTILLSCEVVVFRAG